MPAGVSNREICLLLDGDLCGELTPVRRKWLEARLEATPQASERLALWRRNDAALRLAALEPPVTGLGGTGLGRLDALERAAEPSVRLAPSEAPLRASELARSFGASPGTTGDQRSRASGAALVSAVCGAMGLATLLLLAWG